MYVSPLYFFNAEKQISVVVLALTDLTCAGDFKWTSDADLISAPDEQGTQASQTFECGMDIMIQKFVFSTVDAPMRAQKLIQKYYQEVDLEMSYADQIDFARSFQM